MIIDFRKKKNDPLPITINGEQVDIVRTYKYLGFTVDDKLNWHEHVQNLCKKLNQRMYFLRKLRSFDISDTILKRFYISILESVISFGISCWGAAVTTGDKKKINTIIKKAEKIVNCKLHNVDTLYNNACTRKIESILQDSEHPLNTAFSRSTRSNNILQEQRDKRTVLSLPLSEY